MNSNAISSLLAGACVGLAVALICIAFVLVTPYSYDWNPGLRQPNHDAILVIRLLAAIAIACAILGIGFVRKIPPSPSRVTTSILAVIAIVFALLRIGQTVFL